MGELSFVRMQHVRHLRAPLSASGQAPSEGLDPEDTKLNPRRADAPRQHMGKRPGDCPREGWGARAQVRRCPNPAAGGQGIASGDHGEVPAPISDR